MMRTLTKLVTKAKNEGHSSMRPWDNEAPFPTGSLRFKASSVIANANTPSLNASIRVVSFSSSASRASRSITRLGLAGHASGRFESAFHKAMGALPCVNWDRRSDYPIGAVEAILEDVLR